MILFCFEPLSKNSIVHVTPIFAPKRIATMIGQTVSHYRILKKLGQGGMGVVYVAEDTHLKRRVAVKSLTALDNHYRVRFLREAQAVSRLSHPNIAQVFDYGETPDHQPFIVMELVEGKTLHDILNDGSLPVLEAVRVAASVGEALEEAHRMQIVHRDIKPSNIVINERGQVKVLDFGLAKILDEQIPSGDASNISKLIATRTHSSVVVGTPLYLSPEQATGKPLDGRSDLFALGAVLYECLTGRSAFSGGSPIEIGAQVIHFNPPVPSSLNSHISNELDRITMKALEKNVAQRYQTASEFVHDLRNVEATLSHDAYRAPRVTLRTAQPSTAQPPSAITTIAEAIRRPRLSLATLVAVVFVSALLVWGVAKWWKPAPYKPSANGQDWYDKGTDALRNGAYLQASIALQRAIESDHKFALAHARLAEAWTELDYTERAKDELLIVSNLVPDRTQLRLVDAIYLDAVNNIVTRDFAAAVKNYREIAELLPNEARAYVDLGRAYEKNQEIDHAIENYIKASNLDTQYPTAYLRLGSCYSRKGDVASAAIALDKAHALFSALGNVEGNTEVSRERGVLYEKAGKFAEAKAQFEQALATARASNNDHRAIGAMLEISYLSFTQGLLEEAQNYAQQAVDYAQQKHIERFVTGGLIDLGTMYRGRGDYAKAETLFKQGIEFARNDKARRLEAFGLMNLGGLYIHQLRTDEGLALVQQAYSFFQQGRYHHETLICLTEIGRGNRRKGNFQEALSALQQKLELATQAGNQAQIALAYADIGSVLIELERYPEALKNYDSSYELNQTLNNSLIAYNQHNRANILWKLGQPADARIALEQAFEISNRPASRYQALLPDIELSYATILLSERKFSEAKRRARKALSLAGSTYPNVAIEAKHVLGLAKIFSGESREGLQLCNEAASEAEKAGDDAMLSRALLSQAEALLETGDATKAATISKLVIERLAQHQQLDSLWRAILISALANQKLGNTEKSNSERMRARDVLNQLGQNLGQETYNRYLARPDIKYYLAKLG